MPKKQYQKEKRPSNILKNTYAYTLPVESKADYYGQRFYFPDRKYEDMPHELKCVRNLVAAVLDRAALDLYDNVDRYIQRQAHAWFRSTDERSWSFRWCLQLLDLSPAAGGKLYNEARTKRYARG